MAVQEFRWLRPLLFSSTITQGVIYILRPMITYRALELEAKPATIGLIAAIYALLPVLLALSFGRWVGKVGEGRFLIAGTFAMALSSFALIFSQSVALLMASAALAGLSHLACMVGGQTMVSLRSPDDQYDKYFGYYTFSASLGQMLGPIIAVVVAGTSGVLPESTNAAFIAALLFSLIALLPVLQWRSDAPTVVAVAESSSAFKSAGKLLRNPKVFSAIYISMAISAVADILIVFLPLFGQEKNFSAMSIGIVIAIRAGASMLSRLALGFLSAHFSTKKILTVSTLISFVTLVAMAFASNVYILALIVLIAGLSLGVGQPLTMSLVSMATKPEERAMAVSARLTGNRLGQFIFPAAAGALAAGAGTSAVFIALALLLASSFIPPQS